ncbi:alanine racemase [Sphingomonas sp.]|uniref:alanine racemase n=1 Tax=Sphingomonas sp. TaxID=28214 RepID=UPI0025D530F7|nr:alanine racemase [Sphingomonas sp.]
MTAFRPLRLLLDGDALVANWRWLAGQSGPAACGAAVKADGYGLGAVEVVRRLANAGCRDFFVATWAEAEELGPLPEGTTLSVLHGVRDEDMALARVLEARPVLNTVQQVNRWQATGRPCDVMIDTGMNRLGLSVQHVADGRLADLTIDTLMSHFACADEDSPLNDRQLQDFVTLAGKTSARRMSIANSAGILLGPQNCLGLTRPGLALYGGEPRPEARGHIVQVAFPQAQIVQRRRVARGDSVGYGATFVATQDTEIAILNIGYADGYLRSFGDSGSCGEGRFPVAGRVSMDLLAIAVDAQPDLHEGDWVAIDYDLPTAARASGLSQYELLTVLGRRFDRIWRQS